MRSQKNLTILTYVVTVITIILIIIYMVEYKTQEEKNFYRLITSTTEVKYNAVINHIEQNIDEELIYLSEKALNFVDQNIAFDDTAFLNSIKVNGSVSIVPYEDLTDIEKAQLKNVDKIYHDETFPLILITPIVKEGNIIGALISKYTPSNYHLLLKDYTKANYDNLYIIDHNGNYLYGSTVGSNITDTFNDVKIYNKSIYDIMEYIIDTKSDLLRITINDIDYYFYFNSLNDKYILFETDASFLDQSRTYSQNITTNLFIKIFIILLVFFVYIIFTVYYRYKLAEKNELKIEAVNNSVNGGIILATCSEDLRILYGNEGFYSLIGYNQLEVMESFDNCLRRLVYPKDIAIFTKIQENLNKGIESDYKLRLLSKDNHLVWVHMSISQNSGKNNNTVTIVLLDITESKIRNTEIKNLISSIPGCVLKIDAETWKIEFASDSLYNMLGYEKEEFNQKFQYFYQCIYEEDLPIFEKEKELNKDNIIFEVRLVKKDGYLLWFSFNGKRNFNEDNQEIYQSVIMDITEKMDARNALKKETEKISTVMEMTDEFIFEYLVYEDTLVTTKKFSDVFNSKSIILNFYKNIRNNKFINANDLPIIEETIGDLITIQPFYQFEMRLKNRYGEYEWFNVKCNTLYEEGTPYKVIIKLTNIDEERKKLERLLDISKRDSLSGLFNNSFFARNINDYLAGVGKLGNHCFILFDIDEFKNVNDRYGHMAGDGVIKAYSERLKSIFGIDDILGRIGGDEFGVFMKNTNRKVAYEVMKKVQVLMQEPIVYDGKDIIITSSFGISTFPYDGSSYEELFKKADVACYHSKDLGKNVFAFYDDSMDTAEYEFKHLTYRSTKSDSLLLDTIQLLDKSQVIIDVVRDALEKICDQFNFDYTYIFENDAEYGSFRCSYSFDRETKEINTNLKIHNPASVALMGTVRKDSILYISDLAALANELPDLHQAMMKEKTKSVIITGIFDQGQLKGLFGFGSYETIPYPSQQEIVAIVTFVRLLMSHTYKLRENQKLAIGNQLFKGILSNQELTAYAIDTDTFELLYISPRLKKDMPHLNIHTLCYESIYQRKEMCINCPLKFIGNHDRYSTHLYNENSQKWLGVTASKVDWQYENRQAALIYTFDITGYIEKISYRDPLTGLYNLSKFVLEGNKILKANNKDNEYCLVAADITYLRYINETMGYATGEQLLVSLSETIHNELYENELCCRNNDKFLILFKNDEDIFKRMNSFRKKCLDIVDKIVGSSNSSFTAGIYFIRASDQEVMEAINKAELARHATLNKHNVAVYNETIVKAYEREKLLESMMEDAITNEEFKIYYLPKYQTSNLEIVGLEALTRWYTQNEIIYPNEFIPLFNKNGFINKMSYYCIEQVVKAIRSWINQGYKVLPVAINISYQYLIDRNFISELKTLADKYQIDHSLIEIELQELAFKEDVKPIFNALAKIKKAGFKTTIDDFGSGYSSLIMLKELPINMLKLDKNFLKDGIIEEHDIIIIKNIIKMADELGIVIISEGVETLEQLEFLKAAGCKYVQGYYLSKPLKSDEIEELIKK